MPLLEQSSERIPLGGKFIRDGERIGYGEWNSVHWLLAHQNGLGEQCSDGIFRRLVDDAGYIDVNQEGTIKFSGDSSTCRLRGDPIEARAETVRVTKEVIGRDAIATQE